MRNISFTGVCKSFRTGNTEQVALDQFSANVPGGTLCALLGKNGAGKTTLIKCASGIYLPDAGAILADGKDLTKDKKMRVRTLTVLLDGGRNLYRYMTLEENIKYFTLLKGVRQEQCYMKKLKSQAIEAMDAGGLLSKTIDKLSYGMAQRAAITVAVACASPVIVMDEPTKGLDFVMKRDLISLLKVLKSDFGVTIILSSHDLEFVESLVDYLILIDNGKLLKEGKLSDFHDMLSTSTYTLTFSGKVSAQLAESIKTLSSFICLDEENSELCIKINTSENIVDELVRIRDIGLRITNVKSDDRLSSIVERML